MTWRVCGLGGDHRGRGSFIFKNFVGDEWNFEWEPVFDRLPVKFREDWCDVVSGGSSDEEGAAEF